MNQVRVRMAPSPTGNLHLGTAYTTLFNFLYARHNKGTFILRIEDTDQERSAKEFEENIINGLRWLGLNWDKGPYHMMDRLDDYKKAADKLLAEGKAYYCFCTKEELSVEREKLAEKGLPQIYSGKCRILSEQEIKIKLDQKIPYVIRHKMPEDRGKIEFDDLIHGQISFEASLIGDTVIMRQNNIPLYNFAVVVDDISMDITHVLRAEEHIPNTPKQIVLFEALGAKLPYFAHWPVILNTDRVGKLSKRAGATSVDSYKHEGYLPEAIINYLALLGWTHPESKEIFTMDELIEKFELKDINRSPAAWSPQKLDWINGEYIRAYSNEQLTEKLQEYLVDHPAKDKIVPLVPLIKERIKKLSDFVPLCNFFFAPAEYDQKVFVSLKIDNLKEALEQVKTRLQKLDKPWVSNKFEQTFRDLAKELKISPNQMFQLIRVAISGQLVTPPLFESMMILGEEESINRVQKALDFLVNQ